MRRGNLISVLFHEVPEEKPSQKHYRAGHWSWVDKDEIEKYGYLDKGIAEEWKPPEDNLPDDLPGKKHFLEAGYNDLKVIEHLSDWDAVPGIGQITEDKLVEYFASE